jgi:hypothetical protein
MNSNYSCLYGFATVLVVSFHPKEIPRTVELPARWRLTEYRGIGMRIVPTLVPYG